MAWGSLFCSCSSTVFSQNEGPHSAWKGIATRMHCGVRAHLTSPSPGVPPVPTHPRPQWPPFPFLASLLFSAWSTLPCASGLSASAGPSRTPRPSSVAGSCSSVTQQAPVFYLVPPLSLERHRDRDDACLFTSLPRRLACCWLRAALPEQLQHRETGVKVLVLEWPGCRTFSVVVSG